MYHKNAHKLYKFYKKYARDQPLTGNYIDKIPNFQNLGVRKPTISCPAIVYPSVWSIIFKSDSLYSLVIFWSVNFRSCILVNHM